MPSASQSSVYISTLVESAAIAAAVDPAIDTMTLKAGQTLIAAALSGTSQYPVVYLVYSGQSRTTGVMVPRKDIVYTGTGEDLSLRFPLQQEATVYFGCTGAPDITVYGNKGGVITNNNNATIYFRAGMPNSYGLTIAKPGDTNGNDVQGTPIYAYGQYAFSGDEFPGGTEIWLLGTAGSQTATVYFH